LIGSKPISVFGLTRSFKGDSIREAYLQAYPHLVADLKMKPENRGLVTFISDHLVDFAFLAKGASNSDSDADAGLPNEKPITGLVQEPTLLSPRSLQESPSWELTQMKDDQKAIGVDGGKAGIGPS